MTEPADIRVVRGRPTDDEIAALAVALLALRATTTTAARRRSPWATPVLRRSVVPGQNSWRTSALPR